VGEIIFLSLQSRGAGGEPGAGSPVVGTRWGREVDRRRTAGGVGGPELGMTRLSPSLGVWVTYTLPRAQGCPASFSCVSPCPQHVTRCRPSRWVMPLPCCGVLITPSLGSPGCFPLPAPCLAPRRLCPAALVGTRPARPPAPRPDRDPGDRRPRSFVTPGREPASLPAPACLPCSVSRRKKAMRILLYKKEKKTHVKRILVFIMNILIN